MRAFGWLILVLSIVGLVIASNVFYIVRQSEQAIVLYYGTMIGAEVVYVRSRMPRTIVAAMKELRATTLLAPPQVLQLFWTALMREVDRRGRRVAFDRLRRTTRHLPFPLRRLLCYCNRNRS